MQLDGRFVSVAGTVADGRVAALLSPAALHAGPQRAGRRHTASLVARCGRRLLHRLQAKYSGASGSGSSGSVAASLVRSFSQVRRWDQVAPDKCLSEGFWAKSENLLFPSYVETPIMRCTLVYCPPKPRRY